jgi:hypothetical protein
MPHTSVARAGRALLGVAIGVVVLGGTTAVAAADDQNDPSLIEFTVPNRAAIDNLTTLGFDLAEYQRPVDDGIVINVEATPEQALQLVAMGYPEGNVIESPAHYAAVRAEANAAAAAGADSFANLKAGHAVKRAAAPDTVLTSRADYFENYAGRYISVEAKASDGTNNPATNPVMTASWDGGADPATLGGTGKTGALAPLIDAQPPDGRYYQYHRNIFRVGALNDGQALPTKVQVASSNGGVDTIAVKRWTSADGKGFPAGYVSNFPTGYVDPQQAYQKIRDLAGEFPNLAQIYNLPYQTNGYQRKSQALLGLKTPYTNATGNLGQIPPASGRNPPPPNPGEDTATRQGQAVVLTSLQYGQNGGNDLTTQLKDPGAASQPLAVTVAGNAITVTLATDAAGAITSTAAQIVSAINANPAASNLVVASTYRGNTGNVVVNSSAVTKLTDFLQAPPAYPRGPQTLQMIRIGSHRDGAKTGVLLYCQEHAREWATSLVCLETAERLLRNYSHDAETTSLLDNLDIFIIPVVNADGTAFSRYDFASQRKNMTNYCAGQGLTDPLARNNWGVDINRNFTVGSLFDGYVGASSDCSSDVFAGLLEGSEPEVRDEQWVQSTFKNIKFANNIHSYGGYFMWPPGSYTNVGRVTLPYASAGINQFFDQTAATTLERIQSYRHTTVLPSRTGPVADVLYSAAGNSADEAYYNNQDRSDGTKGIIGYDFEIGVDRFLSTSATCTNPGTVQTNCLTEAGFQPCYSAVGTGGGTGSCPSSGSLVNEGHDESQEFANGNIGLLTAALGYENDHTPPTVTANFAPNPDGSIALTFNQSEPADIYYTLDGSTPTTASAHYQPSGPRQRQQPVQLPAGSHVDLKFIAYDIKNQTSGVQEQLFQTQGSGGVSGTVPAILSLSLGPAAAFTSFVPGVTNTYKATQTATVTSTAGDATLSVADPSPNNTGHLVNGTFFLPEPLQARGVKSDTQGSAPNNVGSGLNLLQWFAPVSNDAVSVEFSQLIKSTDALRTGTYAKTLTFTLSTTNP